MYDLGVWNLYCFTYEMEIYCSGLICLGSAAVSLKKKSLKKKEGLKYVPVLFFFNLSLFN